MKYKAIQLMNHSAIYKDNVICTDREIKKRNKFEWLAEAEQWASDLNEPKQNIKTIVCDVDKLRVK